VKISLSFSNWGNIIFCKGKGLYLPSRKGKIDVKMEENAVGVSGPFLNAFIKTLPF
jgi:hypothetical protein